MDTKTTTVFALNKENVGHFKKKVRIHSMTNFLA
jgi:hypothetical protein